MRPDPAFRTGAVKRTRDFDLSRDTFRADVLCSNRSLQCWIKHIRTRGQHNVTSFSINGGNSTSYTDTTPGGGTTIDFDTLDNSFSVQINGVDLFVGGPAGAPNEAEFQANATAGRTVRFADGDEYGSETPEVWQLGNTNGEPVVRLKINPDGTIRFQGVKSENGPLEDLELYNGMSVNAAAIESAWNTSGSNTIVVDQGVTGPTNASGDFEHVPCFASGTLIETRHGPVPVETLKVADQVLTFDNGHKAIRWIGSRHLSRAQLAANPKLRPIRIRCNALAPGYPTRDLIVSPQHRVLVSSVISLRMFDREEVLIPANKLLPLNGVEVIGDALGGVVYWHILLDSHEIVWSNGTPTESLLTGPQALKAICPERREEIGAIFPEVLEPGFKPVSARYIPQKGRLTKKLVQRHHANKKPLYRLSETATLRHDTPSRRRPERSSRPEA